jgi:hypothetical protein
VSVRSDAVAEVLDAALRIEPSPDGRWAVRLEGHEPLSVHLSANQAEQAAQRHARAMNLDTIVLLDRYCRARTIRGGSEHY